MATTRKGIAAAVGKIVAVSGKIKERAEAVVDMVGDEDIADKKIVAALEKIDTARNQFDKAYTVLTEKAADFGGEETAKNEKPKGDAPTKKRGRKPKAETIEEEKPAKRRGRKPKAEKEEEAAPEPKKRGRKPKAENVEEEKPASKKRGRKPKAEAVEKPAKARKPKASKPKKEDADDDLFGDDIFDEAPKKKKGKKSKKNRG